MQKILWNFIFIVPYYTISMEYNDPISSFSPSATSTSLSSAFLESDSLFSSSPHGEENPPDTTHTLPHIETLYCHSGHQKSLSYIPPFSPVDNIPLPFSDIQDLFSEDFDKSTTSQSLNPLSPKPKQTRSPVFKHNKTSRKKNLITHNSDVILLPELA